MRLTLLATLLPLLLSLISFVSCSAIDRFTGEIKQWRLDTEETRKFLNDVSAKASALSEKVSELDRDQSGDVDLMELLLGLGVLGGGGSTLLALRNGKSNERKARLEAEVASLKGGGLPG